MYRRIKGLTAIFAVLAISGCATLRPNFETPTVTVNNIRLLPSENLIPQFEVGLHIVNPNPIALNIQGMSYTLSIDEFEVLTGVANDLPTVGGYDQEDITLTVTANLISSIRLMSDLFNQQQDTITYNLDAKLDLGGILPSVHVIESGDIDLSNHLP